MAINLKFPSLSLGDERFLFRKMMFKHYNYNKNYFERNLLYRTKFLKTDYEQICLIDKLYLELKNINYTRSSIEDIPELISLHKFYLPSPEWFVNNYRLSFQINHYDETAFIFCQEDENLKSLTLEIFFKK